MKKNHEEEEPKSEDQKTKDEDLSTNSMAQKGNVLPTLSHPFCDKVFTLMNDNLAINGSLKELIDEKLQGKKF